MVWIQDQKQVQRTGRKIIADIKGRQWSRSGISLGAKFMVVLIGLVIIFKTQLTNLVTTIFEKITSESSTI